MKILKNVAALTLAMTILASPYAGMAAEAKGKKLKPYVLKTCVVSDEKLGGEMGKPVHYEYEGRDIQFGCKDCIKTFKKEPAKYVKKIEAGEAKLKK